MIIKIIVFYAMLLLAILIHELGHRPKKIVFKTWHGIPLPMAAAMGCDPKFRLGGLAASAICFSAVYFLTPKYPWNVLGALCWLHFILYAFVGSFNYEPKVPRSMWKYYVFDDVPNEFWFLAVPLSIITYLYFKSYYLPILLGALT